MDVVVSRDSAGRSGYQVHTTRLQVGFVRRDSAAYRNGVRDGAVIVGINDQPVKCWADYQRVARNAPSFVLRLAFATRKERHDAWGAAVSGGGDVRLTVELPTGLTTDGGCRDRLRKTVTVSTRMLFAPANDCGTATRKATRTGKGRGEGHRKAALATEHAGAVGELSLIHI